MANDIQDWFKAVPFTIIGGVVVWLGKKYDWLRMKPREAVDVEKVKQEIDSQQIEDDIKQAKADQDIKDAQNEIIINNQKMAIELIVVLRAELKRAIDNITRLEEELSREKEHCIGIQNKLNDYVAKYGII